MSQVPINRFKPPVWRLQTQSNPHQTKASGRGWFYGSPLLLLALLGAAAHGQSWNAAGPSSGTVTVLTVDPTNSETLYAGTLGAGIFKSTNGGSSWEALPQDRLLDFYYPDYSAICMQGLSVASLAVDPANPKQIYAMGETCGNGAEDGLAQEFFASSNGGMSWYPLVAPSDAFGDVDGFFNSLKITATQPAILYLAGMTPQNWWEASGVVASSSDGGASWSVHKISQLFDVVSLIIDPSTPTTLYALGLACSGETSCLTGTTVSLACRSLDGGKSWSLFGPSKSQTYGLAVDPGASDTLYALASGATGAIYKTTNGGKSWTNLKGATGIDLGYYPIAIDPLSPQTLYVGSAFGNVKKSTDGGATWSSLPAIPFGGQDVSAFVFANRRDESSTLYIDAGTGGWGVASSTDGGESWTAANRGLVATWISALAVDPKTPATIYAGSDDGSGGLFKSVNGGATWSSTNAGLPNSGAVDWGTQALAIDPTNTATVYAAGLPVYGGYGGVFKSTNGGASWQTSIHGSSSTFDFAFALAMSPANPATLYVGTDRGIFKTTNSGGAWNVMNNGLASGSSVAAINALAIDPAAPQTVYASGSLAGSSMIWKSTNGATSWSKVADFGCNSAGGLAADPLKTGKVYCLTTVNQLQGVLALSADGGKSWSKNDLPLPPYFLSNVAVSSLALDPKKAGTIYAGGNAAGLLVSTDDGQSWTQWSMPPAYAILSLAIDAAGKNLYAGTSAGVLSTPIGMGMTATRTTVTSTASTVLYGDKVTFTAKVSSAKGTPTGNVVLYAADGGDGRAVGTATLDKSGEAEIALSSLPVDINGISYSVVASYQGASGLESSLSPALTLTVNGPKAAKPTISPGTGTYHAAQTVTITDSTPNARIYYWIGNASYGTPYTGPLKVSASETLHAFANSDATEDSPAASATYTIVLPAGALPNSER